jgi:hypothetical protein
MLGAEHVARSRTLVRFVVLMVAAPAIALLAFVVPGNAVAFLMIAYPTYWEPRAGIVRSSDGGSTIAATDDTRRRPSLDSTMKASIAGYGADRHIELASPDLQRADPTSPVSAIPAGLAIPGDSSGNLAVAGDAAAHSMPGPRRLTRPTPKRTHAD